MSNWKFVWNDGKFFSSDKKETIEAYAAGAIKIHGAGCGHIEKISCRRPKSRRLIRTLCLRAERISKMDEDIKTVEEIKQYLVRKLNQKYGYCGVASGENMAMLNSGSTNIIIKIEIKA